MNLSFIIRKNIPSYAISVLCLSFALVIINAVTAHAAWDAGNIIDDVVFTNKSSMSVGEIQAFLNSKVPNCDTQGTQPAAEFGRSDLTHAQYAAAVGWPGPPYTCLKDYTQNGLSAAQIIYNASQTYQINPQVLIVLLQKEQGLVADTWPLPSQYRSATGYGCPDTAPCDSQYYGLTNQVNWSATMFHAIMTDSPTWYTPYVLGNNFIKYNPNSSCGGSTVNIQNRATQSLYNYTPYQPNSYVLNGGTSSAYPQCGAFGNINFYNYFTNWFGSTRAFVYNGVNYKDVFDPAFYTANNPDVANAVGTDPIALFLHFIKYGMSEGRVASAEFNVTSYIKRYNDLRDIFHWNQPAYYAHYEQWGKREGRLATGDYIGGTTLFNGVDYSAVYNFDYYVKNNSDLQTAFGLDDASALKHFVKYGMSEGRQASASFIVMSYLKRYNDLRDVFHWNLPAYYTHYVRWGKKEGRITTGDYIGGKTALNGVDYSAVYNFDYYEKNNPDLQTAFGLNDSAALQHFIQYGMSEGRQASADFNVQSYRNNNSDLQTAFENNLKLYYLHYIDYGKKEGRIAT